MTRRRKPKPTPVDELIAEVERTNDPKDLTWLERRLTIDALNLWAARHRGTAGDLDYDWITSETNRVARAIKKRRAELHAAEMPPPQQRREDLDLVTTPPAQWDKARLYHLFRHWAEEERRFVREEVARYLAARKILDQPTIDRFLELAILPYDGANVGLWQQSLCPYERRALGFLVVELLTAWPVSE